MLKQIMARLRASFAPPPPKPPHVAAALARQYEAGQDDAAAGRYDPPHQAELRASYDDGHNLIAFAV